MTELDQYKAHVAMLQAERNLMLSSEMDKALAKINEVLKP